MSTEPTLWYAAIYDDGDDADWSAFDTVEAAQAQAELYLSVTTGPPDRVKVYAFDSALIGWLTDDDVEWSIFDLTTDQLKEV